MNLADKVSIDIPGVGLVEAFNAAQESTLRDILAAIESNGDGGGDGNDIISKLFSDTSKARKENTDELDDSTERSKERGKKAARAVKEFKEATTGVVNAFAGGGGAVDALKAAGEVIEKALSGIPVAGAGLGAAFGFLIAQVTATMENFESAQASGASFGNSMMTLRDISADAGITMGQMSAVAKQAGESLSMFGGGTAQGARDFAKFNRAIKNSGMDSQLLRMGMSIQDQAVAMADYTGQLANYGEKISTLDPAAVSRSFVNLTKQQKMLSQYNGITLEQQRLEMKAKRKDVDLRILTIGKDKEVREGAEALADALKRTGGPIAEQYLKDMMNTGMAMSAETLAFEQNFGELAKVAREGGAKFRNDTLGVGDTLNLLGQIDPAKLEVQIAAAGKQAATLIGTGITNPVIDVLKGVIVPASETLGKAVNDSVGKIQADNAKLAQPVDQLTQSYIKANQDVQEIAVAMEKIATGIMGSDTFNYALNLMTDTMTAAAEKLTKIAGNQTIGFMDSSKKEIDQHKQLGAMGKFENIQGKLVSNLVGIFSEDAEKSMNERREKANVKRIERDNRPEGAMNDLTATLAGAATGALVGSVVPLIGTAIGALIGGGLALWAGKDEKPKGKASGGPVNAGSKYEVNEIGQELFTPSSQGTISPHNAYKNLMSNMSDLVSDMAGMKTRLEKQQGLGTKAPSGVADFAGVISGIMQAGNGLFDTLKTNIMDDMTGITSALTGNNLFGTIAEDITGMMSSLTSQSNLDQESMTQGTAEISNVYKNIMVDMAGMKAQLAEQQTDTIQPVLPATAEASMSQVSNTSSNPFSEDQEVRDALISLPGIMIQNMNHLRSVNDTLEVKLTQLSRSVA